MNTTRAWAYAVGCGLAAMLLLPGAALADDDTTPPTVTLDAGCDGRTLSEYVGPITGVAEDDSGTVTVRVDVDGTTIFGPATTASGQQFSFNWDTRKSSNGPHTMHVNVRDAAGNETTLPCPWTVQNKALTVPFTSPQDGTDVSGTVTLAFEPRADGQPVRTPVRILVDGAELGSVVFPPYELSLDTTQLTDGPHTVTAEMFWLDYPEPQASSTIHIDVSNASGPVAAYAFQESSGSTASDHTGNGHAGKVSGAQRTAGGRYGRALSFDGVNDIVTVPDADPLDLFEGMTLEAWVKPTALSGYRTVALKERPAGLAYALYASAGVNRPSANVSVDHEYAAPGSHALPLNVWSHVAATYDGDHLKVYVNGVEVGSTAVSGGIFSSSRALQIGGNKIWSEWFKGSIDEVRVYDRALTALEIQADRDTPIVAGI